MHKQTKIPQYSKMRHRKLGNTRDINFSVRVETSLNFVDYIALNMNPIEIEHSYPNYGYLLITRNSINCDTHLQPQYALFLYYKKPVRDNKHRPYRTIFHFFLFYSILVHTSPAIQQENHHDNLHSGLPKQCLIPEVILQN